jgi:DNA-binding PadR family transcriptional regulator
LSRLRYLSDLTPAMAKALVRCHTQPVLVRDPAGIKPVTIKALIGHGLLGEGQDRRARKVYKPTDRGLVLIATEEPRLLAQASDALYTSEPGRALFPDAGEAVDETTQRRLSREGRDKDVARDNGADDQLIVTVNGMRQQRWQLVRASVERGLDLRSEVRMLDRMHAAIERKVRDQATQRSRAARAA